jgi:hypothetical protein
MDSKSLKLKRSALSNTGIPANSNPPKCTVSNSFYAEMTESINQMTGVRKERVILFWNREEEAQLGQRSTGMVHDECIDRRFGVFIK